mmetsp:Transcript_27139/g.58123  ORF Transcript_27139/g.58123 Transcript_27139/m.58123 type:complete len:221 (-) Transcript_27139:2780-3442(-)
MKCWRNYSVRCSIHSQSVQESRTFHTCSALQHLLLPAISFGFGAPGGDTPSQAESHPRGAPLHRRHSTSVVGIGHVLPTLSREPPCTVPWQHRAPHLPDPSHPFSSFPLPLPGSSRPISSISSPPPWCCRRAAICKSNGPLCSAPWRRCDRPFPKSARPVKCEHELLRGYHLLRSPSAVEVVILFHHRHYRAVVLPHREYSIEKCYDAWSKVVCWHHRRH